MNTRIRIPAVALLVALLAACATSPTGRRQLMMVSEDYAISASAQAYVETLAPLERQGRVDTDPFVNQRVREIAGRLVAQAINMRPDTRKWQWSIKVIDDEKTVNAWCMAGGKMALYTGLILKIKPSDDELAQVIGHEIAHAVANHTAEKMSMAMASSLGVAAIAIASDNRKVALGAAAAAALAVTLPNSRAAETEADRIGIELAARAGYDPNAAVTLWRKMGQLGGGAPPEFLSTHPASDTRLQYLSNLVPDMLPYYLSRSPRPVFPL